MVLFSLFIAVSSIVSVVHGVIVVLTQAKRDSFRRGLSTEGNFRFQIDWANLIVGSKFTVSALCYFVFECNFLSTNSRWAYIWRGSYMEGLIYGILC